MQEEACAHDKDMVELQGAGQDQPPPPLLRAGEPLLDPVLAAVAISLRERERVRAPTMRRGGARRSTVLLGCSDACSSTCSNGRSASLPKRVSIHTDARGTGAGGGNNEGLLPYVPKAWEVYVLIAIPMAPFLLVAFFLVPMLLED
jgi:hypothetical protein